MNGIINEFFFLRKGEEVAIERHCSPVPVDKDKHTRVLELKKRFDRILRIEETCSSVWNWWFLAWQNRPRELCYSTDTDGQT